LDKLNVISVPIFSTKYSSNILKLLNKNQKTLLITDSSKTIFFEEIKNQILATSKIKSVKNFDLDHNKIKNVKDYNNLLGDMGVTKKKLYKYLF
jgi:predicted ATP-dependent serine protease